MTNKEIETVKLGLSCCAKVYPDCNNCPYYTDGRNNCDSLSVDALTLVHELLEKTSGSISVPAPIGTKIYFVNTTTNKVTKEEIGGYYYDGTTLRFHTCRFDAHYHDASEIGTKFFLSRDDASAQLAELLSKDM